MNRVMSFRRALVIVSMLTVCITTAVSAAGLLNGLWFKLKLSVKGEEMSSTGTLVGKINISAPMYVNFVGTGGHGYTFHYWTLTDAGWTNSFTESYIGQGTDDWFFADTSVQLLGQDGSSLHTFHTIFINSKLSASGTVEKATYTGVGEINEGTIIDGTATNSVFGGDTITGSTVETNKLPFTP
ncbi:MAG: hypothetical protein ABSG14_01565 [Verrucomicrobiia bacterium]